MLIDLDEALKLARAKDPLFYPIESNPAKAGMWAAEVVMPKHGRVHVEGRGLHGAREQLIRYLAGDSDTRLRILRGPK